MRELNPRAWSIDSECWCTRVDYDGYKEEWSGIVPVLAPDNRSKRIGEVEDTNIIVEFPTGIKDKNGKEIYEGDVVNIQGIKYYVDFEHGGFWFNNDNRKWKANRPFTHFQEINDTEVVGNVHENADLLEKE